VTDTRHLIYQTIGVSVKDSLKLRTKKGGKVSKKLISLLLMSILLVGLLAVISACGATPEPTQAPAQPTAVPTTVPTPAATALKMTGPALEVSWTEDQLKALGTIDVDYTGKDGTTTTYTGVLITKLLEEAKAPADAAGLVLVASDAYTVAIAMADVQGCADCIVAFDPAGGLRSVLPQLSGKSQVKNLVEIQVQGGAAPAAGGIPENAALKITGKVATPIGWTEEAVRAMKTIDAQSTNKQGETQTYTGVLISDLLALAGPASDATTLVFVADDGFTAEVPLADVLACADCIVSFRSQGGFSTVLPGFAGSVQVKGVIEIQVK